MEHVLQLAGHFFHAWRRHNFYTDGRCRHFNFNFCRIQLTFTQFFTK